MATQFAREAFFKCQVIIKHTAREKYKMQYVLEYKFFSKNDPKIRPKYYKLSPEYIRKLLKRATNNSS